MDDEQIPVCVHCWIEVERPIEGKPLIGQDPGGWIHKSVRSPTGTQFCGKQRLEEEDIEYVSSVSEA